MTIIKEEKAKINIGIGNVFYNPQMRFCRSFFSLAVGAAVETLGKEISIVDATAASGIRGIRYKLENPGIDRLYLVDINKEASKLAAKNIKLNKVKNAKSLHLDANEFFHGEESGNFIELDPFGTPIHLLYDAIRSSKNRNYLSVTATDAAVLCGAHGHACIKNYSAKPINNEFCHENAIRILLGKICRVAAENGFGIKPLVSLSKQHFVKVLVQLETSAEKSVSSMEETGFSWYCSACLARGSKKGIVPELQRKCPDCGKGVEFGGPMWLGELHDAKFLKIMEKLNLERDYVDKEEIDEVIRLMQEESGMPNFYYNIHAVCKRLKKPAKKLSCVAEKLRSSGFRVTLTHFQPNCIKTTAPLSEVRKAVS